MNSIICPNCGSPELRKINQNEYQCNHCGTHSKNLNNQTIIMIGWPCPKCGNENEANVVFCVNCGNQIIKYCQKCGTGVPVNGKYCPECRNDTFDISGKYDVILTNTGWKKIYVIREIRVWSKMKLGLYEAKSMADKPPSLIAVEIPLKEGQQLKSSLEKYGATVELRPHINKK